MASFVSFTALDASTCWIVALGRLPSFLVIVLTCTACSMTAQPSMPRCGEFGPAGSACQHRSQTTSGSNSFDQWFSLLAGADTTALTVDSVGQIYIAGTTWNGLPVTPDGFQQTDSLPG